MKKTYLSYEAPEVELVEMAVECGFAASIGEHDAFEEEVDASSAWY